MNCAEIKLKLQELTDGRLSVKDIGVVKKHIKTCPQCRKEYKFLKFVSKSVSSLNYPKLSDGFNAKVMSSLGFSAKPALIKRPLIWVAAFASAMMLCLISVTAVFLVIKTGAGGSLDIITDLSKAMVFLSVGFSKLVMYAKQAIIILMSLKTVILAFLDLTKILALTAMFSVFCAGLVGLLSTKRQNAAVSLI